MGHLRRPAEEDRTQGGPGEPELTWKAGGTVAVERQWKGSRIIIFKCGGEKGRQ